MLEQEQIKILMRLHELEQSLAAMYSLFSEKFPAHRELWTILIKEELEHADAVQKLYARTYKNAAFFSEGSIRLAAVEAILNYVKRTCDVVRLDQMTAEQALDLSRDVEKSVIAKNIFEHFEVDLEFTSQLWHLRDSSEKHAQLVQMEIDRHNQTTRVTGD
jgi:hypothetical protein